MTLAEAIEIIDEELCRLDNAYGRPLFDEWAVVSADGRLVFHYNGQREERFAEDFPDDMAHLRAEIEADGGESFTGGEFGFVREVDAHCYDAYLCLGPGRFLVCNHTRKCMAEVTRDPAWLKAQGVYVDLSQRFAMNPLTSL